jgi:hypothetical protein
MLQLLVLPDYNTYWVLCVLASGSIAWPACVAITNKCMYAWDEPQTPAPWSYQQ